MTADELIEAVAAECFWPLTNRPRSAAELLGIADRKIVQKVWPKAVAAQTDYYVCALDHAITATYSRYRLPRRLYGPVRDLLWVDAQDPDTEISIPAIDLDGIGHATQGYSRCGFHYFIDGDFVGLKPTPDATANKLRIRYFRAPSKLVLVAESTTVAACDFETDPTAITLVDGSVFAQGDVLDVIGQGNAHAVLAEDVTASTLVGNSMTADRSLLGSGVERGDYVCAQGTTPLVQVPDFMLPWLVLEVAAAAVFNEPDEAKRLRMEALEAEKACTPVTSPRSYADPVVFIDRNNPLRRRAG